MGGMAWMFLVTALMVVFFLGCAVENVFLERQRRERRRSLVQAALPEIDAAVMCVTGALMVYIMGTTFWSGAFWALCIESARRRVREHDAREIGNIASEAERRFGRVIGRNAR